MLSVLSVVLAALAAGPLEQLPDTALFPSREAMVRLYTNCDEARWPGGANEELVPKTLEELTAGVARRRALEERWRAYFAGRGGDSILPTPPDAWVYPLAVRGRLLNNYANPRADGPHEALDIFVPREGTPVRAPASGVVVAAGDDWQGGWVRRRGFWYESGGLSRRAGNGVILFDPGSGGYHYLVHLQPGVLVRTGDVVRAGEAIGRVGHSGNAAYPSRGRHLHYAFKRAGTGCGVEGVLVPENPYRAVRAARNRMR
jgi:murein DD-endopeptidase MepM/ murein hydrolase activator NlpD